MKTMKKCGVVALMMFALQSYGQDSTDRMKTVFTKSHFHLPKFLGAYISPEIQYGQIGGAFTPLAGGSAMWIVNKKFGFGVAGFMNINPNLSPADYKGQYLRAGYGGMKLEYTPNPNAAIHVSFPLIIGVGVANADSLNNRWFGNGRRDGRNKSDIERPDNTVAYFVVQPGIQIEANLFRFMKLYVGANYRIGTTENATAPLTKSAFNGFSVNTGMKVGLFDLSLQRNKIKSAQKIRKRDRNLNNIQQN